MSMKKICDGCGTDVHTGDGLARVLQLSTGNNHATWDLCDPCQGKVTDALIKLLPGTPRESWYSAIRPTKSA
jgi:hypothetical protein